MPFVDRGACPFEGCIYRDWVARAPVTIVEDPQRLWFDATALSLGDDPDAFITYDARLAGAARSQRLRVLQPGA